MKGEERRKQLLNILSSSNNPVSGGTLAKELNVLAKLQDYEPVDFWGGQE